jgi:hypothetical protein
MINLIKLNKYEVKAKTFILKVINNNPKKSYNDLMVDLKNKLHEWEYELRKLDNAHNLLTDKNRERYNYLKHLVPLANTTYINYKYKKEKIY